jgi:hypothetical protein
MAAMAVLAVSHLFLEQLLIMRAAAVAARVMLPAELVGQAAAGLVGQIQELTAVLERRTLAAAAAEMGFQTLQQGREVRVS